MRLSPKVSKINNTKHYWMLWICSCLFFLQDLDRHNLLINSITKISDTHCRISKCCIVVLIILWCSIKQNSPFLPFPQLPPKLSSGPSLSVEWKDLEKKALRLHEEFWVWFLVLYRGTIAWEWKYLIKKFLM